MTKNAVKRHFYERYAIYKILIPISFRNNIIVIIKNNPGRYLAKKIKENEFEIKFFFLCSKKQEI